MTGPDVLPSPSWEPMLRVLSLSAQRARHREVEPMHRPSPGYSFLRIEKRQFADRRPAHDELAAQFVDGEEILILVQNSFSDQETSIIV